MKRIISNLSTLLVMAIVASSAWVLLSNTRATAHDGKNHNAKVVQAQTNNPSSASAKPITYAYTAQQGDSYTLMARKAVQTYGKKAKIKLSAAKIIYAETNLTQQAGSPHLHVTQKVNITESTVKQWVDKAQALTPQQEAAWNYYVQFANFNTDKVGETR
jgi:hypothetical protein